MPSVTMWVECKCVSCGHKRRVYAGEVAPGDMPECDKCYSIMVATKATSKKSP